MEPLGIKSFGPVYHPGCYYEEDALMMVRQDPMLLHLIENKTPKICLEAVSLNGLALQYINRQTPEICLAAVSQNGKALQYVREQTEEICLAAVKQDGMALVYVKDWYQTAEICLAALDQNIDAYKYCIPFVVRAAFRQFATLTKEQRMAARWREEIE